MPRERSPERDKAFAIFQEHGGNIANREIAKQLGIPEKSVGGWKVKDRWNERLNGVLQIEKRSTPKRGGGAPKGNRNAVGNSGGPGGPVGNDKAVTHGFFRRILPDDEETRQIMAEIHGMSPLDIIWNNIVLQFTNIARAQRIMWVEDKNDRTKVQVREKLDVNGDVAEQEWEYQHAWDKQANFMQAQSRAILALEKLIEQYEAMLPKGMKMEEQRLRLEKLRAEIDRVKNPEGDDVENWISEVEEIAQRREERRHNTNE